MELAGSEFLVFKMKPKVQSMLYIGETMEILDGLNPSKF